MIEVIFPSMSENDPEAEGVVSTWFVSDGDHVEDGDLVAEVSVDKVDMEIFAPHAGTISILVKEDQAVKQNNPIATIA